MNASDHLQAMLMDCTESQRAHLGCMCFQSDSSRQAHISFVWHKSKFCPFIRVSAHNALYSHHTLPQPERGGVGGPSDGVGLRVESGSGMHAGVNYWKIQDVRLNGAPHSAVPLFSPVL